MREKDKLERALENYADVFADIVNVLLFDGNRKVNPADLRERTPRSTYKGGRSLFDQERDEAKYWIVDGVAYALVGLENQSDINQYMPIRTIGYDGADYRHQIRILDDEKRAFRKEKKWRKTAGDPSAETMIFNPPPMYPVITLVLYFGMSRWTAPRKLKECLKIPEGFDPYVNDYRINLFEIAYLPDETIAKFRSDFRYVAELTKQGRLLKEKKITHLRLAEIEIRHARETLDLLFAMTGDRRFKETMNEIAKGRKIDMFAAFDIYEKRGEERGEKRAREKERVNTERERKRADVAEARAEKAEARAGQAEARAEKAEAENQKLREQLAALQAEKDNHPLNVSFSDRS